jgi:RHS repeat-associated protein
MSMPSRTTEGGTYRYGFNGKETDQETGIQDYGMRWYLPNIARFPSVDPLTQEYPWYTPYQFAGNTPIQAIDLDGAEELRINDDIEKCFSTELKILREDKVLSKYLKAITNPDLREKHLVIIKFDYGTSPEKTMQASTMLLSPTEGAAQYFKYYKQYPNAITPQIQAKMDEVLSKYINRGFTTLEAEDIVMRERVVHIVSFNPTQANTTLDWSLNNFIHEIDIHLIKDIKGIIRTEMHQDHKESFMYEKLNEDQKKVVDRGDSPPAFTLPEGSHGSNLYKEITDAIKHNNYLKDNSSETQKERNNIIKTSKSKN